MNETMYDVTWIYDLGNDSFSHAKVNPVTIIRDGILPGCSAPSITIRNHLGQTYLSSRKNYFETEEAAWDSVIDGLKRTIENNERERASLMQENAKIQAYLNTLLEIKKR